VTLPLIDKLVAADSAGDRHHLHVGRHFRDEMGRVELLQRRFAAAAGQHWNVIDIGVFDHRIERIISAPGHEFMSNVFLPEPR